MHIQKLHKGPQAVANTLHDWNQRQMRMMGLWPMPAALDQGHVVAQQGGNGRNNKMVYKLPDSTQMAMATKCARRVHENNQSMKMLVILLPVQLVQTRLTTSKPWLQANVT
jgi:hypothetical protein